MVVALKKVKLGGIAIHICDPRERVHLVVLNALCIVRVKWICSTQREKDYHNMLVCQF